jgi:SNF family Na+-dependent transporter
MTDREQNRDRWSSNLTFIVAAVGCAIGLGNLWRFPYLCFKHGGAGFLIPYSLCLVFLGIPMLILEFGLGQVLQKGNIAVWQSLHPRLYGLGLATCIACYLVVIYYNVIISWALTMFFNSFYSPLPWSTENAKPVTCTDEELAAGCVPTTQPTYKTCKDVFITQEFFYKDVLGLITEDCEQYDQSSTMGEGSFFQWQVWLSAMLTWLICFFCTFQGVKISSYVVWITVPLPIVLVFIMVMNGFTLKNSDYGFRMYLKGYVNDEPIDFGEKLETPAIWSEACGQIFFTLSICWGVMVSYASYNPRNAPVIKNGVAVALINCTFSFFAGFSVFAVVGYLVGLNSPVADKYSSAGLAYIAFPAAINTMPAANFWALIFFLTLFTLGIDSAFAMVEGTVIVIQDSSLGKRFSKFTIATACCVVGAAGTTLFCFNWGFALFDSLDHYLNIYTILSMGVLQAVACCWYFGQDAAQAKHKGSANILLFGYWVVLLILPWLQYFTFKDDASVGVWIFWIWLILVWIVSCCAATIGGKMPFKEWYEEIFLSGIRPLCEHFCALSETPWHWASKRVFEFWWGFSLKYVFSWAIYTLLIMTLEADLDAPYGDYHAGWQWLGAIIPVVCILLFVIYLVIPPKEQPSGEFQRVFALENVGKIVENNNKVAPTAELSANKVNM